MTTKIYIENEKTVICDDDKIVYNKTPEGAEITYTVGGEASKVHLYPWHRVIKVEMMYSEDNRDNSEISDESENLSSL